MNELRGWNATLSSAMMDCLCCSISIPNCKRAIDVNSSMIFCSIYGSILRQTVFDGIDFSSTVDEQCKPDQFISSSDSCNVSRRSYKKIPIFNQLHQMPPTFRPSRYNDIFLPPSLMAFANERINGISQFERLII